MIKIEEFIAMNSVTLMKPDSADLYDCKLTRFKSGDECGMYLP